MDSPIQKAPTPDDPNRCQGVNSQGQCPNLALPGCDFCIAHGGAAQQKSLVDHSVSNYILDKWNARLQRQRESAGIKSLRDEIGILRMVLEQTLNSCKSENDLVLHSGRISDLVSKIEKLVASCHKLEGSMGNLLDKQTIIQFVSEIIEIISQECDDTTVEVVASRILVTLEK